MMDYSVQLLANGLFPGADVSVQAIGSRTIFLRTHARPFAHVARAPMRVADKAIRKNEGAQRRAFS